MSIFIDSNIFIAFANKRDKNHERALQLMDDVRRGKFGRAYTSDYIFDEAVTVALIRTRRPDIAVKVGKLILGSAREGIPRIARMITVDERIFLKAWENFQSGRFKGLSFTDHTILAQIKEYGIDMLLSFDTDFDGLTVRVC